MKEYKTNITAGFCKQWSKSKAIQEYTSNMLDEGDYNFVFGEDYVELRNHNIKVDPRALLLGLSDKVGDSTKIGFFGCGIPQSMAALLSQEVSITIYNADVIWTPSFQYDEHWGEEVLVINEETNYGDNTCDYVVVISGLDSNDIAEISDRCLIFQEREVLHHTKIGDIICGAEGEIFVGSVFVTQDDSFKYSYNFNTDVIKLTQDRNMIDSWELRKLTAKLISLIEDEDFVKEAIEDNSYDTSLVHERFYTDKPHSKDTHAAVATLGAEFIAENEGKLVTDDYSEHQENIKLGNPSVYMDNRAKVKSIQDSDVYKTSIATIELIEKQTIDEFIEELNENIMQIVDKSMNAEDGARVKQLLDCLTDEASNW
tara:strand:+ start:2499 stop:3611 length:1113 start_codon:yes stop_codon:yes gene_type:complete